MWNQVINVLHSGYFMASVFSHTKMHHKKIVVKVMSFVAVFKLWYKIEGLIHLVRTLNIPKN